MSDTPAPPDARNSLSRMLAVLDLFHAQQSVIDVELIGTRLGCAPATAYRYVRALCAVGLLVRLPRGYAVGPRVIELERHMRQFDPLLMASADLVDDLVLSTQLALLISERYGDKVVNILQRSVDGSPVLSHGRGQPMDLFRSATARVILAHLLPRQLRRVFDAAAPSEVSHIGDTWKAFSRSMALIRRDGYCLSEGELDVGTSGIAAPIFDEKQRILGSLTLVGPTGRFEALGREALALRVVEAAGVVTRRIAG